MVTAQVKYSTDSVPSTKRQTYEGQPGGTSAVKRATEQTAMPQQLVAESPKAEEKHKQLVDLHVSMLGGSTVSITAEATWTITDVKEHLNDELGIQPEKQRLLLGEQVLQDSMQLQMIGTDNGTVPNLSLVCCRTLQAEDIHVFQTQRDGIDGCTEYLVVATHTPSGQSIEHVYCRYHPLAGPITPDPVQNLRVEKAGSQLVVMWEWSENSFDVASPGAFFKRPVLLDDEAFKWASSCTYVKKAPPPRPRPEPPSLQLAPEEELCVADVVISDQGAIVVQHKQSCSEVRHELGEDGRSFFDLELTQAGGYVRAQFRERCKYQRDVWVSNHCRFVKLCAGHLVWVS